MRALSLVVIAVLLDTVALVAQESPYRAKARHQADSLRASLTCPANVAWPPLPETEHRTYRTAIVDSAGLTRIPNAKDSVQLLARPDVVVPQYAFYYYEGFRGEEAVCIPVIIVQAEGGSLGWLPALEPAPAAMGVAGDAFFDLLGTDPPQY